MSRKTQVVAVAQRIGSSPCYGGRPLSSAQASSRRHYCLARVRLEVVRVPCKCPSRPRESPCKAASQPPSGPAQGTLAACMASKGHGRAARPILA
jgi:hypothetical protein